MQILKAIATGALGALMVGSSVAFAADLGDFPAPFVQDSTANALFVVGATAATDDVVGAINIAARLGGAPVTTEAVTVAGTTGTLNINGEGREIGTIPTPIFLGDSLGKVGLRTTMTKDDMATLLASGTLSDTDRATTHNYAQYVDLTPSSTTSTSYRLEFERPGSISTLDPAYDFGRFPTSPSSTDYAYRTRVVFASNVQTSTAVGEKLTLFGGEYVISSGTTGSLAGTSSDKVVLFGGAETHVLSGGESITVTLGGTTYTVTLIGTSSTTQAVVKVGSDQKTVGKDTAAKIGGLDVYISDVFHLSTTDQTQNSAKILLGAQKITLQHGSKVKLGDNEDPVDGTSVALTVSSGNLSQITVYVGGRSSTSDYMSEGVNYIDPLWKTFSINFLQMVPKIGDASRNTLKIAGSGDNLLQATWTDDKSKQATFNWAYKASSTGTTFNLADNGGDPIHVLEGETVKRDDYIILDAGDFPRFFEITGVSLDSSTSAGIDMRDVFTGTTVKITTGSDNIEAAVIEGQTYNFFNISSTTFTVTWGNQSNISSGNNSASGQGSFLTIWPRLKGKTGEHLAFITSNTTVNITGRADKVIQFPTGAIGLTQGGTGGETLTARPSINEDGTTSACQATTCFTLHMNSTQANVTFVLGRTSSAGVNYTMYYRGPNDNRTLWSVTTGAQAQPGFILVEEKDDAGNVNDVIVRASYEASGSNQIAIPGQPAYTDTTNGGVTEVTRGSDSNKLEAVDIYGTYHLRATSGQDTLEIQYPDDQAVAKIAVLKSGATAAIGGAAGTATTQKVVPIKTAIAKLDSEVATADKETKNLILVGGPAVNTLVAELADAGKSWTLEQWRDGTRESTAIIQLVEDAFAAGQSVLIVAGHSAADTRSAALLVQNYDANAADFEGNTGVTVVDGVITGALELA